MSLSALFDELNDRERHRRTIWAKPVLSAQDKLELQLLDDRIEELWEDIRHVKAGDGQVLNPEALRKAKKIVGQVSQTITRTTFAGLEHY